MLKIDKINAFHGKVRALWDISLTVVEREIVALVGGNGSGKTTMFYSISGILPPASGTMHFLGKKIDGMPAHQIVKLGICYIPEGGKPFPDMTVRENLEMGAYIFKAWKRKEETLEQVYRLFPVLKERAGQWASALSGGERQMLAIGRGLMSRPRLCMFDEPSYGLSPLLVKEFFDIIKTLREQGVTIFLAEQNVRNALEISDRAYVLENGRIVLEGKSGELLQNSHIKKAYLGL